MSDSRAMKAEREVQLRFIVWRAVGCLSLLTGILWIFTQMERLPNREELGERASSVDIRPVRMSSGKLAPLSLAGAWEVTSADPRVGGVSALAVDGPWLLALTDSGAIVRFARPGSGEREASVFELPDGPASGRRKSHRDSEALLRDPAGRGWLVTFESRHQLWLYDQAFGKALAHASLRRLRLPSNSGIEGVAADRGALLLFPESGGTAVRIGQGRVEHLQLTDSTARISDAAALPDGSILILERQPTFRGFRNALAWLEPDPAGYRVVRRVALPLGPFDNAEALAVEPRPDGLRLWVMTDDGFLGPLRTLLLALDWPVRQAGRERP